MDNKNLVAIFSALIGFVITVLLVQFGFFKTLLIICITILAGLLGIWISNNSTLVKNIIKK